MAIMEVSVEDIKKKIQEGGLVLVDFFASWCMPCQQISGILEEVDKDHHDNYQMYKVDVEKEDNKEFVNQYMIMSLPTVVLFYQGKKADSFIGLQSKETIREMMQKILQKNS